MSRVGDWGLECERKRRENLENFAERIAGQEEKLAGLLERLDVIDGLEARIDFLEGLFEGIEGKISNIESKEIHVENDEYLDELTTSSIDIKRGVAAYGLKSLGKTNREIASILWPKEEYDENRHGPYIRRAVRAAKAMLKNLTNVLPQD